MAFLGRGAQASLEYLMTYAWALVLIASVIGVLIFVATPSDSGASFSSSDPTKIMVKGQSFTGGVVIKLQNITGGSIEITKIVLPSGYSNCLVNGIDPLSGITTGIPLAILAGGEIGIECDGAAQTKDPILIIYKDYADLGRSITLTPSKPPVTPAQPTVISSCGYTVPGPGRYVLESDLPTLGDYCITVFGVNNVSIDCQGHKIQGGIWDAGIYASGTEQLTVQNCNFDYLTMGLWLDGAVGATVRNNSANNSLKWGLILEGLSNSLVEGNTVTSALFPLADGFEIEGNDNLVRNNVSCNSTADNFGCSGSNNTGSGNKGTADELGNQCGFAIDQLC